MASLGGTRSSAPLSPKGWAEEPRAGTVDRSAFGVDLPGMIQPDPYFAIPPVAVVWRAKREKAGEVVAHSGRMFDLLRERSRERAAVLCIATETAILGPSSLGVLNFYLEFDPGFKCWQRLQGGGTRWRTKWGWRDFQRHCRFEWVTLRQSQLALPVEAAAISAMPGGLGIRPAGSRRR